jgi:hypothetical protein
MLQMDVRFTWAPSGMQSFRGMDKLEHGRTMRVTLREAGAPDALHNLTLVTSTKFTLPPYASIFPPPCDETDKTWQLVNVDAKQLTLVFNGTGRVYTLTRVEKSALRAWCERTLPNWTARQWLLGAAVCGGVAVLAAGAARMRKK